MVANGVDPPMAAPAAKSGEPRTTIAGRYEVDLDAPLGAGGLSLVYRGKDLRTRRNVAVKTLRLEYRDDPQTRARFRREARLLAFLSHPNVIRVFDLVEDRGTSWVVLEHLSGRSVKDLLSERGTLDPAAAGRILDQVAAALSHLHERGLVHLDVKPQNLLLAEDGRVKLIDFGLAQPVGTVQQAIDGRSRGAADYLAPEQACGEPVDVTTDVYALGCVVYELLTGQPPFASGRPGNPRNDVVRARLAESAEPPSHVRPDLLLPAWVDDVLLWALAREPGARYGTVESFGPDLPRGRRWRAGADIRTMGPVAAPGRAGRMSMTGASAPFRVTVADAAGGAGSPGERLDRRRGGWARRVPWLQHVLWRLSSVWRCSMSSWRVYCSWFGVAFLTCMIRWDECDQGTPRGSSPPTFGCGTLPARRRRRFGHSMLATRCTSRAPPSRTMVVAGGQ